MARATVQKCEAKGKTQGNKLDHSQGSNMRENDHITTHQDADDLTRTQWESGEHKVHTRGGERKQSTIAAVTVKISQSGINKVFLFYSMGRKKLDKTRGVHTQLPK